MEYRALGRSGLRVSVLTMGTMTFGGAGAFADVGSTDNEEAERQVDMCLDAGVNLIDTADVYSSGLAEEILGQALRGRRNHQAPVGSRQLSGWGEPPVYDPEGLYDLVELLISIAEQHEVSAAQVALAWTLGRPGVTSLVIGARTGDQLADNLEAASLSLADEERARLDAASAPPLIYPYWHQAKTARDRLSPADLTLLGPHLA